MWPYDEVRPKAALPILNKPLIGRLIDDLGAAGVRHFIVVVGHGAQRVRHALSGRDGIVFVSQDQPNGTAEAVLLAMPHVDGESFLVVYGDIVLDIADVKALIAAFQSGAVPLAALVRPLGAEDSRDWLCASVAGGAIVAVEGHPRSGQTRLCGVYAMHQQAARYVVDNPGLMSVQIGGMPPVEAELAASVQMMIEGGIEVPAVEASGLFVDLDKPWHILEANEASIAAAANEMSGVQAADGATISDAADIRGPVVLSAGASIGSRTVVEGPLWVGAGTTIENGPMLGRGVVLGPHCRVANYCQIGDGSVIGPHNVVDHCAEVSGVTMDRVYLTHYLEFWGVIGSASDLGAATVCGNLRFDDGQTAHRVLGRREVPRRGANAVYIGDYCRTGVNAILMPGVKVGPYSCIGPGVIAQGDVPARSLLLLKQEVVRMDWGPERHGW